MEILIKALQFILSLSILVIVHELGHFVTAKIFKTRVEKFYLFFNPWFSIFKFKYGETEYGMGWLPLGGYVKISGMIDESMDKDQMKLPPQPHEFRSKPAWQRLIIMLGGVTVNLIFAILIYITMLAIAGEQYLPTKNLKYGIACDSLGLEMGLKNGDKILSLDNKYVENFQQIPSELILNEVKTIQVERDSAKTEVKIPSGTLSKLIKLKKVGFITYRIPFVIEDFVAGSVAKKAGIQKGDRIVGLNDKSVLYYDEFRTEIVKHKGKPIEISVDRTGKIEKYKLTVPETGLIGVAAKSPDAFLDFNTRTYSFLEAIPAGTLKAFSTSADYIKQLKLLFSPEVKAYESLGGFITIGSVFSATWDWMHFWSITAFLSIILAIMNVLPIPALDGGHVLFLLYEIVTRRKPSDKFLEYAQIGGMILLVALLLFANGNDILKLFK